MRQPYRNISGFSQIVDLPLSFRFTEESLRSNSSLPSELHWRFLLVPPSCPRQPTLGPEKEAGKLDAHISLGIDDPDPVLFKQATRFFRGYSGNQK
jgi:hypothetical protein